MSGIDWSRATISELKLTGYLLDLSHTEGGSKARFFRIFGYSELNTSALTEALRRQAAGAEIRSMPHALGTKLVADGVFYATDGRPRRLRSVWVLEREAEHPRLVTALPLETRHDRGA